ncbi:hypothetical protein LVJ94_11425 [Pendulispora rubella]|uniref:Uncharacterized protein n=1 Tax=Pendulispora rubella TaxID=2741070 RepID=A0ABZ2LA87_9BACT
MILLRGAAALLFAFAFGSHLDPCSKLGIRAEKPGENAPVSGSAVVASGAPMSAEQVSIEEAKKLCASGDCLTAHDRIHIAFPPNAPFRQTAEFKTIENQWAKAAIDGAASDPDVAARRKVLEEVMASTVVDAPYKTQARDTLAKLPAGQAANTDPDASAADASSADAGDAKSKEKDKDRGHRHRSRSREEK